MNILALRSNAHMSGVHFLISHPLARMPGTHPNYYLLGFSAKGTPNSTKGCTRLFMGTSIANKFGFIGMHLDTCGYIWVYMVTYGSAHVGAYGYKLVDVGAYVCIWVDMDRDM